MVRMLFQIIFSSINYKITRHIHIIFVVNFNTRMSFSSISAMLSAGQDSNSYRVQCLLEVYDSVDGVSTSTSTVIVEPSSGSCLHGLKYVDHK